MIDCAQGIETGTKLADAALLKLPADRRMRAAQKKNQALGHNNGGEFFYEGEDKPSRKRRASNKNGVGGYPGEYDSSYSDGDGGFYSGDHWSEEDYEDESAGGSQGSAALGHSSGGGSGGRMAYRDAPSGSGGAPSAYGAGLSAYGGTRPFGRGLPPVDCDATHMLANVAFAMAQQAEEEARGGEAYAAYARAASSNGGGHSGGGGSGSGGYDAHAPNHFRPPNATGPRSARRPVDRPAGRPGPPTGSPRHAQHDVEPAYPRSGWDPVPPVPQRRRTAVSQVSRFADPVHGPAHGLAHGPAHGTAHGSAHGGGPQHRPAGAFREDPMHGEDAWNPPERSFGTRAFSGAPQPADAHARLQVSSAQGPSRKGFPIHNPPPKLAYLPATGPGLLRPDPGPRLPGSGSGQASSGVAKSELPRKKRQVPEEQPRRSGWPKQADREGAASQAAGFQTAAPLMYDQSKVEVVSAFLGVRLSKADIAGKRVQLPRSVVESNLALFQKRCVAGTLA